MFAGSCEPSGIPKSVPSRRCLRCLRCLRLSCRVVEAAATGFPAVLDDLHQRGYDAKSEDFSGRSVAQDAAEGGHIEVLSLGRALMTSRNYAMTMPWPYAIPGDAMPIAQAPGPLGFCGTD